MAATGYDVVAGDTWALNELSSAVRQGTGNARANMRAFLNGLYDGDGTLPPARGTVFVAGIGQATADLSLYQARLQDWYEDSAFWSDLGRFASDWSQELYGDIRHYAVPGATREARRDLLNEYLQHQSVLAGVAPSSADAARGFLRDFYSPLANAAWRYDAAFGWTDVPVELMQDYVSAQTYAHALCGQQPLRLRLVAEEPGRDPDATTSTPRPTPCSSGSPRRSPNPARCPRLRAARPGARRASPAPPPRPPGARSRAWKPSRIAFTSPEQTVLAGCTLGAADRRAADECRDRVHGRDPRDRRALVVLADDRALDRPGWSLVVDAGASDRLRREQRELLRPRRDGRPRHDHGRRCRQDIGQPGDHGCGARRPLPRPRRLPPAAARLRPTSSFRRTRHRPPRSSSRPRRLPGPHWSGPRSAPSARRRE